MKKNVLTAVLCVTSMLTAFISCKKEMMETKEAMTSEQLIGQCAGALGGYDVINNIRTLHVKAIYPDHGDIPMELIIKRPNKSFNPRASLVFDGERICFTKGQDGQSEPELAPEGDWKDGEVEIAYHFPAFFEYPAELTGTENAGSNKYYKLKVDLPLGAEITYFIDSKTFLTAKVMFRFNMSGSEINDWRDLGNYKDVDGFKYPHSFSYNSRTGRQNGRIHSIEINIPVKDDLFTIPDF